MQQIYSKNSYVALLRQVKDRIRFAQYEALKSVNQELIQLYWDIGKMIVNRQKREGWGKAVVERLAIDLQKEFPGTGGLSTSNLWRMKGFYEAYFSHEKLAPLVREISWSHNLVILEKCSDDFEREFYIRMTKRMGWSKNVLIHQIENKTYEKTLTSKTNFKTTLPEKIRRQAVFAVKDEYTFDFLELGEAHSETELERALISKMNKFLIEMGGAFAFMGNQFRLEVDGSEFFIDILLYHRRLKCLVALELKVGEFKPEYVGKMQFYLTALDEKVREKGEGPSVGIIMCKGRKATIVEYALRQSKRPIGVAKYKMTAKLPKEFKNELPAPDQVQKLLEGLTFK